MKSKAIKSVFIAVLLIVFSCDKPETIVTNIVHPDETIRINLIFLICRFLLTAPGS
jgi:hypothetical protein